MTELDLTLTRCLKGEIDQSSYYELFLNSQYYLPVATEKDEAGEAGTGETIAPIMLTEGEGKTSLLLFDTEERMNSWTNGAVGYRLLPGHVIVEMVTEGKYLALNVGTKFKKEFIPAEIDYLKSVVRQVREAMPEG